MRGRGRSLTLCYGGGNWEVSHITERKGNSDLVLSTLGEGEVGGCAWNSVENRYEKEIPNLKG